MTGIRSICDSSYVDIVLLTCVDGSFCCCSRNEFSSIVRRPTVWFSQRSRRGTILQRIWKNTRNCAEKWLRICGKYHTTLWVPDTQI